MWEMNRRLSVRLSEGLARGIEALAQRSGKTKSEIVRDALTTTGIRVPPSRELRREGLRRATQFREQQGEVVDAVALIRESREELDRRSKAMAPAEKHPRCRGRREPQQAVRTTPGFQQTF
jgi:predicted DNA-binding protein